MVLTWKSGELMNMAKFNYSLSHFHEESVM